MTDLLSSGNKDKIEIMASIIAMTQKPASVFQIKNKSGLSHQVVKKYLKMMSNYALIEEIKPENKKRPIFISTQKGIELLEAYCQILKIIYGADFMKKVGNLAVYCLKFCQDD